MPKTLNTADDFEMVPITSIKPHERNVNQGDFGAIQESIEANGFFGALVVQRSTRKILAGNHRFAVAKKMGFSELPVVWVDCDDDRALRILLADNRTARLGNDNPNALAELLAELARTEGALAGTGRSGRGNHEGSRWYGDNAQVTVMEIPLGPSKDHPTMKPVALLELHLSNSTPVNGLVYDPFLGAGTTLIACETLGRYCRGLEITPEYCDVIIARWETATGKTAELIEHGTPH